MAQSISSEPRWVPFCIGMGPFNKRYYLCLRLPRFCSQLEKSRGRLAWSRTNRPRCGLQTDMIGHYLAGPVFLRNLGNHCKPSDQDHINVPLWLYRPQKCTNQTALLHVLLSFPSSFVSCIIFFCFLFSYFTSFFSFAWLLYYEFMWYDISSLNGHVACALWANID